LILDNAGNAISGTIAINEGAVQVDDVFKLGNASLAMGGGTLVLTGTMAMSNSKALALHAGGGTLQVDTTGGVTHSGPITGTGGFTKTGDGMLTLAGNKSFTGGVTVSKGTLFVNAGGWYTNPFGSPNTLTINAGGTVETVAAHTLGTDQNTVVINGGTLKLGREQYITTLQMTGGLVTGNTDPLTELRNWGGTMVVNASDTGAEIATRFNTVGSATLQVADGTADGDLVISGPVVGANPLVKTGDGKLVLKGLNTHTGNTTVTAGTLELFQDARLTFAIGNASGSNNRLSGTGTVILNGNFAINTTAAAALTAGTWLLEDVPSLTGAYGADFKVVNPDGSLWANTGNLWTMTSGSQAWSFDETSGTLTLTQSGYGGWASVNAPGQTPGQDYDGDGVENGVEYVVGGTKNTNDLGKLPRAGTSGGDMTFTFLRNRNSLTPDTTLAIEVGTGLSAWPAAYPVPNTPGILGPVTVTDNGDGTDTVVLTLTRSPDPAKFARLKVTITQ
jgi:autotransporter-associated beta strand protein